MFYEYLCDQCGGYCESQAFTRVGEELPHSTCECGGHLTRAVSVPNTTPIALSTPVYNPTVGQYVTGSKDFERKLHEGQRRMSERLGYDQKFAPIYPSEAKAYHESTANDDKVKGESIEKYGRIYNKINDKRTIII